MWGVPANVHNQLYEGVCQHVLVCSGTCECASVHTSSLKHRLCAYIPLCVCEHMCVCSACVYIGHHMYAHLYVCPVHAFVCVHVYDFYMCVHLV